MLRDSFSPLKGSERQPLNAIFLRKRMQTMLSGTIFSRFHVRLFFFLLILGGGCHQSPDMEDCDPVIRVFFFLYTEG